MSGASSGQTDPIETTLIVSITRDDEDLAHDKWNCLIRSKGNSSICSFHRIDFTDLSQLQVETCASIEDGTRVIESDDALILLKLQEPHDAHTNDNSEKTVGAETAQPRGAFFAIVPETGWSKFKAVSERRSVKP